MPWPLKDVFQTLQSKQELDRKQRARLPACPTAVSRLITSQCPLTRSTHGASTAPQRKSAPCSAPTEAPWLQGPASWYRQGTDPWAQAALSCPETGLPGDATLSPSSPAGPLRGKKFEAWLCKLNSSQPNPVYAVLPLGGPLQDPS